VPRIRRGNQAAIPKHKFAWLPLVLILHARGLLKMLIRRASREGVIARMEAQRARLATLS
jgi:hypothetical protein